MEGEAIRMSESLHRKSLNLPDKTVKRIEQVAEKEGINFTDAVALLVRYGWFVFDSNDQAMEIVVDGKEVILL